MLIRKCVGSEIQKYTLPIQEKSKDLLSIGEAAELLSLTIPTIYSKVHYRTIPFMKTKGSKTLRFSRKKLMEWLQEGQKETQSKLDQKATDYLVSKR